MEEPMVQTALRPSAFPLPQREPESLFKMAFGRLIRNPQGAFGVGMTCFLVLVAILAPVISPYDPLTVHTNTLLHPPDGLQGPYMLGTDQFGRDIFSRIIWGTRISLAVGLLAVGLGAVVGVTTGLIGGHWGGRVESVLSRIWDTILAFPAILLGVAITAALGPGTLNAAIAVAIINMPIFYRITRASVFVEKEKDYITAARALGASDLRIVFRGMMPNVISPLLVQVTVAMAQAVLLEASLSFLGLGAQPPEPSWGSMLNESRQYLRQAMHFGVFPGIALMMLLSGLNTLSDALRDVLDPRQIQKGH
ncbi:MAG: ABC transporter permease [Chloroflexota bacterium]